MTFRQKVAYLVILGMIIVVATIALSALGAPVNIIIELAGVLLDPTTDIILFVVGVVIAFIVWLRWPRDKM